MLSGNRGDRSQKEQRIEKEVEDEERLQPAEDIRERCIVSIVQNQANEVGLAVFNIGDSSVIWIAQYVEATRSYLTTRTMLQLHPPDRVLVVARKDGVQDLQRYGNLNGALENIRKTYLSRFMFDDTEGFVRVQECATGSSLAEISDLRGHYLAIGAAGALLRYIQDERRLVISGCSLEIRSILSPHHVHIDSASIKTLELVAPVTQRGHRRKGGISLLKFLDGTFTKAGAQLLRANILQPLRDIPTLNARYDALEELLQKSDLLRSVCTCLSQMPRNIDGMVGSLILHPAKTDKGTLRRIQSMVSAFIQLKELLTALSPMADALSTAQSSLFHALHRLVSTEKLSHLLIRLEGTLDDDVRTAKGAFLNRTQQCFAIRAGKDALLDSARRQFCECADAVHDLAESMRETHDIPSLRVQYATRRGFYFTIPSNFQEDDLEVNRSMKSRLKTLSSRSSEEPVVNSRFVQQCQRKMPYHRLQKRKADIGSHIPSIFTILGESAQVLQVTTDDLNALNFRMKQASDECLCRTEEILENISTDILEEYLPSLRRITDGIAILDMVCGFARKLAETRRSYARPTLTPTGSVALVDLRHPILESLDTVLYQPNDVYFGFEASFHVITGPNMSGKSTHLRATALSIIMAQIGCFVPASFASLTPIDRLMTRMGTSDSLENNSSSFMVETQETAYILRHATGESLVIIDELGRATSTADGVAIAWSVAEGLISIGARTMLTTHFQQLAELAVMYPPVHAYHFEVIKSSNGSLDYSWKLKPGPQESDHYGLELARAVGFPSSVLDHAATVARVWDQDKARLITRQMSARERDHEILKWELVGKLLCLAQADSFSQDKDAILKRLRALQCEAQSILSQSQTMEA